MQCAVSTVQGALQHSKNQLSRSGENRGQKGRGGSDKLQLYHIPSVLKFSSFKSSGPSVQGSSDALSQPPTPTCGLYPLAPTSLPWALLGERSESFLLRLCLPSPTLLAPICDFEGFWKFTDLNIRRWEFPSLRDSFPLGPPQGLSGSQGSLTKNLVCVKAALPCNTPAPSLSHQSQPFLFLSE